MTSVVLDADVIGAMAPSLVESVGHLGGQCAQARQAEVGMDPSLILRAPALLVLQMHHGRDKTRMLVGGKSGIRGVLRVSEREWNWIRANTDAGGIASIIMH